MPSQADLQACAITDLFFEYPFDWADLRDAALGYRDRGYAEEPYTSYEAIYFGASFFDAIEDTRSFGTDDALSYRIREARAVGDALDLTIYTLHHLQRAIDKSDFAIIMAADEVFNHSQNFLDRLPEPVRERHSRKLIAEAVSYVVIEEYGFVRPEARPALMGSLLFRPNL